MTKREIILLYIGDLKSKVPQSEARDNRIKKLETELQAQGDRVMKEKINHLLSLQYPTRQDMRECMWLQKEYIDELEKNWTPNNKTHQRRQSYDQRTIQDSMGM